MTKVLLEQADRLVCQYIIFCLGKPAFCAIVVELAEGGSAISAPTRSSLKTNCLSFARMTKDQEGRHFYPN